MEGGKILAGKLSLIGSNKCNIGQKQSQKGCVWSIVNDGVALQGRKYVVIFEGGGVVMVFGPNMDSCISFSIFGSHLKD